MLKIKVIPFNNHFFELDDFEWLRYDKNRLGILEWRLTHKVVTKIPNEDWQIEIPEIVIIRGVSNVKSFKYCPEASNINIVYLEETLPTIEVHFNVKVVM